MSTKKETKKPVTSTAKVEKTVAPAKEVKKAEPAKKIETKKAETKSIETKKDTTKAIETRAGILKDTEKKAVKKAAPKKTTKKAATKVEYFLQFGGKELSDKELLQEVKNCASGYYETGSDLVDLTGALEELKDKNKKIDKEINLLRNEKNKVIEEINHNCEYIQNSANKLESDYKKVEIGRAHV